MTLAACRKIAVFDRSRRCRSHYLGFVGFEIKCTQQNLCYDGCGLCIVMHCW